MSSLVRGKQILLGALLFLLIGLQASAAGRGEASSEIQAPRLMVVVVIDQFRADYLVRFRDRFGPDGFNRLLREGANFISCFYPYARTNTAPGHATLATGTTPDRHGIADNSWYDYEHGRRVAAVFDETSPIVGSRDERPGVSPRNLVGTTLADELRLATAGKGKVFGVALKDRAAVFSTGHTASGAYWYDPRAGTYITSRYYREQLPGWVVAFNQQRSARSYYGRDWKAGERVFLSLTTDSGQPDAQFYKRFPSTPYGNDMVVDFARELVIQEGLGADTVTDFLFVGFSSNDLVGHRWGPYSEEVADMTVRTDAQIAELLKFLDHRVGAGNYWFVVSADHGVAPTLDRARARGIEAKNIEARTLLETLEQALDERWGEDDWFLPRARLTFNRDTLRRHGVGVAEAAHAAGEAALAVDGILGYVAGVETRLDTALTEAVRRSIYRWRTPDLYILGEPFALLNGEQGGTTHGSPYSYDTHVPLIFYGPVFRPGVYPEQVSPTDLAPTLAAALGINPPALANGRVLAEALRISREQLPASPE